MVDVRKSNPCDVIRYIVSALLLLFALVVTIYAIWFQQTMFWDIVPGWAALILFVVDLFILGVVEGLQIALVELKRQHPDTYQKSHPRAHRLGQIAAKGDNVERFLMGRQVFVVVLVFFCAKLTTIHLEEGDNFLFPVPHWFKLVFLESGILSCVVVVIIAQLMPQIVAAKYPVHFLNIILMWPAYYMCVFVEITGITHICWVLSYLMSLATGMTKGEDEFNSVTQLYKRSDSESSDSSSTDDASVEDGQDGEAEGGSDKEIIISVIDVEKRIEQKQFSRFTQLVRKMNALITPDTMAATRHYLDKHPEKFHQYPAVIGGKMYPAPQTIATELETQGQNVPKFLKPVSDTEHIPPHIVAFELLAENKMLKEELSFLQNKIKSLTS